MLYSIGSVGSFEWKAISAKLPPKEDKSWKVTRERDTVYIACDVSWDDLRAKFAPLCVALICGEQALSTFGRPGKDERPPAEYALKPPVPSIVRYEHHGKLVAVRSGLKDLHREHCLCSSCKRDPYDLAKPKCAIAAAVYENCKKFGIVTPLWECPEYEE